jgi:hypothetical protein
MTANAIVKLVLLLLCFIAASEIEYREIGEQHEHQINSNSTDFNNRAGRLRSTK